MPKWLAVLGLGAMVGCDGALPDIPPTRDDLLSTAGVDSIVYSAWPAATSPTEDLSFRFDGDVPDSVPLFRIRDLLARPDGSVYVANSGSGEVLFLSADGTPRWRAGALGDGPGEFRSLVGLEAWSGDTIVALDGRPSSISFWISDGTHAGTIVTPPLVPDPDPRIALSIPSSLIGVLTDSTAVMLGPERAYALGRPGLRRVVTDLSLVDTDMGVHKLAILPGPIVYELAKSDPLPVVLTPLSPGVPIAVRGDQIVWAKADSYEIVVLNRDGSVDRRIRFDEPVPAIDATTQRLFLESWRPWFATQEEIPFPGLTPAFDRVFVAADTAIWARKFHWSDAAGYEAPDDDGLEGPEEWVRLPADGSAPTLLQFRPGVRIRTATSSAAFGVKRDEWDVETVVRFVFSNPSGNQ